MPIGPTGDRTVEDGDVLFGMMDERKYAICRVTGTHSGIGAKKTE